jgi:hypothetical protein
MPLVMGACEVVGDGLGDVADGDGLAEVGEGDGLADVGDGDGDGLLTGGVVGELQGPGDGVLLCPADAPGMGAPERPCDGELELFSVAPPPLVLGFPPTWLEVPGWLPPSAPKPMKPKPRWIFPRAKTPPTTITTAPATARVGRSQFTTGPCELRGPSS